MLNESRCFFLRFIEVSVGFALTMPGSIPNHYNQIPLRSQIAPVDSQVAFSINSMTSKSILSGFE